MPTNNTNLQDVGAPVRSALGNGVSEVTDVGDRWLVGLANHLSQAGRRAQREAGIVRDSAEAAFRTTVSVVRRMSGQPQATPDDPSTPIATSAATRETEAAHGTSADPVSPPEDPPSPETVADPPAVGPSPAGVVPALQALGKVIDEHVEEGGAGLQTDPRFWGIVTLLQSLTVTAAPAQTVGTKDGN